MARDRSLLRRTEHLDHLVQMLDGGLQPQVLLRRLHGGRRREQWVEGGGRGEIEVSDRPDAPASTTWTTAAARRRTDAREACQHRAARLQHTHTNLHQRRFYNGDPVKLPRVAGVSKWPVERERGERGASAAGAMRTVSEGSHCGFLSIWT